MPNFSSLAGLEVGEKFVVVVVGGVGGGTRDYAPRRMCQLGLVKSFEIKKCHILLHLPHFFS